MMNASSMADAARMGVEDAAWSGYARKPQRSHNSGF